MANYQLTRLVHPSERTLQLRQPAIGLCIGTLFCLAACSEQADTSVTVQPAGQTDHAAAINIDLGPLQKLVNTESRKSIIFAEALRLSIEQFLQAPNATQHAHVQAAWLKAHSAYADLSNLPLPAFISLDSDISLTANRLQYQLDAWPIEPGYLDSLDAHPGSGIISDINVPMTSASLQEQHGFTDAQEVSIGFHALEYLIFARDLTDFQILDTDAPKLDNEFRHASTDERQSELTDGLRREIILRRRNALRIIAEQINLDLASLFAMNEAGYSSLESNTAEAQRVMLGLALSIVQHLRRAALQVIDDNERLIALDVGHGEYSATRQQLLAAELRGLTLTLFEPVNLTALATANGNATIDALRITLQEAELNAGAEAITTDDRARLSLLLAALPHLLDDLAQLISLQSKRTQ
ncbi:MAG: hypothetical protein ACI8PP_000135 [Candidatus Pseudothioglobus sp.]|jgi:hypothetical protein